MNITAAKLYLESLIVTPAERHLWEQGKKVAILKMITDQGKTIQTGPYPDHPLHDECVKKFTAELEAYVKTPGAAKDVCVAFTDSICAIPGRLLTAIDFHWGISGSGGSNTYRMAAEMLPKLFAAGLNPRWIVTGCDIGNPLLQLWDYDVAIREARKNHAGIRSLAPNAKIIRYGLPPTWDPYVTSHRFQAEQDLYTICLNDSISSLRAGSVYVSLSNLGGFGGLWPLEANSAEGIHLSQGGVVKLDKKLWKARELPPGMVA